MLHGKLVFFPYISISSLIKLTGDKYKSETTADLPVQIGPSDNGLSYFKIPIDIKHRKMHRRNIHVLSPILINTYTPTQAVKSPTKPELFWQDKPQMKISVLCQHQSSTISAYQSLKH